MLNHEYRKEEFVISTDPARLDIRVIHDFLSSSSYWAQGIPIETVKKSIDGSFCFGIYHSNKQIGFARVITDKATFAYLADVFVDENYRGRGLGVWLMEIITSHPDLAGLRRWVLGTRDAHGLYRKFGFTELSHPERFMQILNPDVYKKAQTS